MASETLELEGTWEEILSHAAELAGKRVKLTLIESEPDEKSHSRIRPENQAAMEVLRLIQENPLSREEIQVLEDFEQFRKDHPIRFRQPEDFD